MAAVTEYKLAQSGIGKGKCNAMQCNARQRILMINISLVTCCVIRAKARTAFPCSAISLVINFHVLCGEESVSFTLMLVYIFTLVVLKDE